MRLAPCYTNSELILWQEHSESVDLRQRIRPPTASKGTDVLYHVTYGQMQNWKMHILVLVWSWYDDSSAIHCKIMIFSFFRDLDLDLWPSYPKIKSVLS